MAIKSNEQNQIRPLHLAAAGLLFTGLALVVRAFRPRSFDNVVVMAGRTSLTYYDAGRQTKTHIGAVLGAPGSCAATRPGGTHRPTTIYPTSEWMREIIFVSDEIAANPAQVASALAWLGPARLGNDSLVRGCQHVSKNVSLTQVYIKSGNWAEMPYSTQGHSSAYSIAASGRLTAAGFSAGDIWISGQEWNPASQDLRPIYDDIKNNRGLPISTPCDAL